MPNDREPPLPGSQRGEPSPDTGTKLAAATFGGLLAGIALTSLFVWLDPFHVFGAGRSADFRSYRDAPAAAKGLQDGRSTAMPTQRLIVRTAVATRHRLDELADQAEAPVVVPSEAVLRTGRRQVVIVAAAAGRFEAREVTLGTKSAGFTEVIRGLAAGEVVVTSTQSLLDAEAELRATIARLGNDEAPADERGAEGNSPPTPHRIPDP